MIKVLLIYVTVIPIMKWVEQKIRLFFLSIVHVHQILNVSQFNHRLCFYAQQLRFYYIMLMLPTVAFSHSIPVYRASQLYFITQYIYFIFLCYYYLCLYIFLQNKINAHHWTIFILPRFLSVAWWFNFRMKHNWLFVNNAAFFVNSSWYTRFILWQPR